MPGRKYEFPYGYTDGYSCSFERKEEGPIFKCGIMRYEKEEEEGEEGIQREAG